MQVPESVGWLTEYADMINSEIARLFPTTGSTDLEMAVNDALSTGGKRVRGILSLLWCETYSGDPRPAVPLGVAYELAHASALVQDDIIDRSRMRRGQESVTARYGLDTAMLASDLLLFNVPRMMAAYGRLEGSRLAKIFDLLGEACRASTWGEYLDLQMANGAYDEAGYETMIKLKTSSLLSAPSASGALVGGGSEAQALLASRFGEEAGMAYQIQDDMLDLVGDEAVLGKPRFTDLRGGKKGIVLSHLTDHCSTEERDFVNGLLGRQGGYTDDEVSKLLRMVNECGSLAHAREAATLHIGRANKLLDSLGDTQARARLLDLTGYLASRYY